MSSVADRSSTCAQIVTSGYNLRFLASLAVLFSIHRFRLNVAFCLYPIANKTRSKIEGQSKVGLALNSARYLKDGLSIHPAEPFKSISLSFVILLNQAINIVCIGHYD